MSQSRALTNRQIARAAAVVVLGFLASGVLGFLRVAIVAQQFGTGEALDAFLAAQRIPEIIFVLVAGGALGSSFIPVYARLRQQDEEEAWRLASAVTTLAALATAVLGIVVALAAPWLVSAILRPGETPEAQALTANLTRLMMVTPVIFSVSGLVMGILQSHQQFLLPALAISMNNIGIIIGALWIAPLLPPVPGVGQVQSNNVYGLAYGAILSALLHLAVQLPGLWRIRARLRLLPDWRVPGVVEVLALMGPRVLGLAVVQVNFVVNIILTSPMLPGSLSALVTAFMLMFFVLGVIGQSVGSAVFPTLSALAAEGDMSGFKDRLSTAMRNVLFLAFPATVGLIVLGEPIVRLFERGAWTPESTAATTWALTFFAFGIVGHSLLEVLSRAFYALADTRTPVMVGVASMLVNIALSLAFIPVIRDPNIASHGPFGGLALANSLATLLEGLALWWLLRRRIGGLNDAHILDGAWRALLAAVGMGIAVWIAVSAAEAYSALATVLLGVVVGGVVFFGLGIALGLHEARALPALVLRRIRPQAL